MRFFFRSRGFKIIVAAAAALIAVSVICAFFGSRMSPQADIMGTAYRALPLGGGKGDRRGFRFY